MTMASASEASGVIAIPSAARRPSIRSESTRFLAQPRLTKATDSTSGPASAGSAGRVGIADVDGLDIRAEIISREAGAGSTP